MPRRTVVAVASAILAFARGVAAQEPLVTAPLDRGTVVRLHLFSGATEAVRLVAPFEPASVALTYCPFNARPCGPAPDPLRVTRPAADVERMDVRVGSKAGEGFLIGAALGLALGVASARLSGGLCECRTGSSDDVLYPIAGTLVWGGIGALLGSGSSRWGPAP
ncbi:MAG: hypothetical protein ACREMV_00350 [Gemmatimonadales bacterium]